jgi:hypothetical protein
MADLWLEKELSRQLAPVTAPESLWDRINQQPRRPRYRVVFDRAFWPVAAVVLLLAVAGVVHTIGVDRDSEMLTGEELAGIGASGTLDFRSDNFEAARQWVKAEANIDIDVPAGHIDAPAGHGAADRGSVRLVGVRMTRLRGLPVAAVDYRVGDEGATLFVSGKRAAPAGNGPASRHVFLPTKSTADARLYSWSMRDQTYAIKFSGAENSHAACLLCHSSSPG